MLKLLIFTLTLLSTALCYPKGPGGGHGNKKNPQFILTDIRYSQYMTYSTPAHLAVYGGDIYFNLTNTDVPYVTQCHAFGNHLMNMFYGEFTYTCDNPAAATGNTTFTFSEPDFSFTVNQTWTRGKKLFLGQASGKAVLNCTQDNWTNPNWTPGQLYSTSTENCGPASLTLEPTVSVTHEKPS